MFYYFIMGKSVLLSKDSIRFKNTNGVVTTTLTVNNDGNIDISGRLIGDISGDNISTPMASSSVLGGVKINGNNLSIDGNGLLSVSGNLSQWTTSSNDIYYTTGKVGIGTQTPDDKLHIYGNSTSTAVFIGEEGSTNKASILKYLQGGGNGGTSGRLWLGHWGDSDNQGVGLNVVKGGNVGIGTTSPNQKLHIDGGRLLVNNGLTLGGTEKECINLGLNGSWTNAINSKVVNAIEDIRNYIGIAPIYSENTRNTVLSVHGNGNVGIGTTSPSQKLHINGGATGGWLMTSNNANTDGVMFGLDAAGTAIVTSMSSSNKLELKTDNTTRLTIAADGNVGVGTSTNTFPSKLEVNGGNIMIKQAGKAQSSSPAFGTTDANTSIAGLIMMSTSSTYQQGLWFIQNNGVHLCGISGTRTVGNLWGTHLSFYTDNNQGSDSDPRNTHERMRIIQNGNVGIGTTSPSQKLDVNGNMRLELGMKFLIGGNVTQNNRAGIFWHDINNYDYAISRTSANWTPPYAQMLIAFHTGIQINPGSLHGKSYVDIVGGGAKVNNVAVTSDNRAKHNEEDISGCLQTLSKLRPQKYLKSCYIHDGSFNYYSSNHNFDLSDVPIDAKWESGFIAQDVSNNVPELKHLVRGEEYEIDGSGNEIPTPLSFNYDCLHAYQVGAIQELHREQQADKERIASLEARIAALENT